MRWKLFYYSILSKLKSQLCRTRVVSVTTTYTATWKGKSITQQRLISWISWMKAAFPRKSIDLWFWRVLADTRLTISNTICMQNGSKEVSGRWRLSVTGLSLLRNSYCYFTIRDVSWILLDSQQVIVLLFLRIVFMEKSKYMCPVQA